MTDHIGFSEPLINCAELAPPESVLLAVPPSLVRQLCVIPIAADSQTTTLVHPNDDLFTDRNRAQLAFVLNRPFVWIPCNRGDIQKAIDRLYSDEFAGIQNCGQHPRTLCPHRWRSLCNTPINDVRYCSTCTKNVFLCRTQDDIDINSRDGKIVAVSDELVTGNFFL